MAGDLWRPVAHATADKASAHVARERGVRLYCTRSGSFVGADNARWSLQVRAPIKLGSGREGKDFIISTASIGPEDMVALRDMITAELEEAGYLKRRGMFKSKGKRR